MGSTWVTFAVDDWWQLRIVWCLAGDPPGSTIEFAIQNYPAWWFGLHTRTGSDAVLELRGKTKGNSGLSDMFAPAWHISPGISRQ